jgi:putative cell wall-binding protein
MRKRIFAIIVVIAFLLTLVAGVIAAPTYAAAAYQRLAGADRYATSAAISKSGWQTADTVVIALGDDFPDGLAGGPLAYKLNAPLLLTRKDQLPDAVKQEIARLKPQKAYILGGPKVIYDSVKQALEDDGIAVERVYGEDRAATAAEIAKIIGAPDGKAVIATGRNFPDALAMSPIAAANNMPILFVYGSTMPAATLQALKDMQIEQVDVLGGDKIIPQAIADKLKSMGILVRRIYGSNRELTALEIAKAYGGVADGAFVATGYDYADALAVAPLVAKKGQPLLLCGKDKVDKDVSAYIANSGLTIDEVTVAGGKGAVSDAAVSKLFTPVPIDTSPGNPAGGKITVYYDDQLLEAVRAHADFVIADSAPNADQMKAYYNKARSIVSQIIKPGMTDFQKEKAVHDYIANNVQYDVENYYNNTIPRESYSPYGALIKGIAVCEGYAEATDLLLNLAGIESTIVVGEADNGSARGDHAWNIVKINGMYRHLDTTWDDPLSPWNGITVEYDYFNLTDDEMSIDHFWDKSQYPSCTSLVPILQIGDWDCSKEENLRKLEDYIAERVNIRRINMGLPQMKRVTADEIDNMPPLPDIKPIGLMFHVDTNLIFHAEDIERLIHSLPIDVTGNAKYFSVNVTFLDDQPTPDYGGLISTMLSQR